MLKQRVLTATALASVFLGILLLAPAVVFLIFAAVVVGISAWEWSNLSGVQNKIVRVMYVSATLSGALLVWFFVYQWQWVQLQDFLVVAAGWWALALLWVQGYPSSAVIWQPKPIRLVMGLFVVIPALISLYALRNLDQGPLIVLSVVLIVAAADIGAYFSGKKFGRRKLSPQVSPGKSWEGVLGGLVLVTLIAAGFSVLIPSVPLWQCLAIAIPTALVSVLGDLLESMLKRYRGVKDSGALLPGHGGVLDRVDGLVAALPVFTLGLLQWL